jgi:hypothetical protein
MCARSHRVCTTLRAPSTPAQVYALGADGASQSIIVSNCTFTDLSGGSVKLGKSGERGAPAPDPATPVAQQDRGYLVQDNLMLSNTQEYSSANPIFVGYVSCRASLPLLRAWVPVVF